MTYSVIYKSAFSYITNREDVVALETNDLTAAELRRDELAAKGMKVRIEESN